MRRAKDLQSMTCEQLFQVWQTEPESLVLMDLRDPQEFQQHHIPGACRVEPSDSQVLPIVERLAHGQKLLVIIPAQNAQVPPHWLSPHVVVLAHPEDWVKNQHPIAGKDCFQILLRQREDVPMNKNENLLFQQLFEPSSSTYTYLLADKKTKEAVLIDPVLETVQRDLNLIKELDLKLLYVLDTHIHADHVTGAGELRKLTGAKTCVSHHAEVACVDIALEQGQQLTFGEHVIEVLETPGHTNTCLSFVCGTMVFTGDALLIRGCGRTDFQQGSSEQLFQSVHSKLFQLPDDTVLYPGHDYRGFTSSLIGLEKAHNPRLKMGTSIEAFKQVMSELKLANPKKIHEAVPANMACGRLADGRVLHPQVTDGIPEVSVSDVATHLEAVRAGKLRLIDVRRPDEFDNELGHVPGAELVTLGPELTNFLTTAARDQEIVFVCRSGGRSGQATAESQGLGFQKTVNMVGGMLRWNEQKLPIERKG